MKKSTTIILLCVLTVASLLLALPFTPLRISFKSTAGNYINDAIKGLGVDFNGKIKKARLIAKAHQLEGIGLDISTVNDGNHRISAEGSYSGMNQNGSLQISGAYGNKNQNQPEGNYAGGVAGFGLTSSGKSSGNSSTQSGGFVSISSNLASANGTTSRQGVTKQSYSPEKGGTHPGVDPTGNGPSPSPMGTLPIGNGNLILFFFALVLASIKAKRIITH